MKDIREYSGIYLACIDVDFRKSITGLAHKVCDPLNRDRKNLTQFEKELNELGASGWEMVSFCLSGAFGEPVVAISSVLKRNNKNKPLLDNYCG